MAILMTDLSRLSEELVLWTSAEFGMIEMPEEFVATSSIMPQKKNPVVAEIARAKAGRLAGDLLGALTIMKALPQSYSLDMQDLTPMLWDAVDQTRSSIRAMSKLMSAIEPKPDVMRRRAEEGFATATELADVLVRRAGLAFREAHAVVGRMIAKAVKEGKSQQALRVEDLQDAGQEVLGKGIQINVEEFKGALDVDKCIESRVLPGGPAPKAIKAQLKGLKKAAKKHGKIMRTRMRTIKKAEAKLLKEIRRRSK
jgi:argininosuccinate lyase